MTSRSLAARYGAGWNTFGLRRPTFADAPTWGGAAAAALGTIALVGWFLDANTLKSLGPGLVTMKANTAVCFMSMGVGVVRLSRAAVPSVGRSVALALVVAAALVALVTGAQYVVGVDLGIDQLLFREHAGEVGTIVAGRMSPVTAICFTLVGLAALVGVRAPRMVLALSGLALALAVLNVFNVVFDARVPSFFAGYTQMAVSSAIAMGFLAAAVIGLLVRANPFTVLAGGSPTAILLRRVLLVLLAVPALMAWLTLAGQRAGFFDASYGTSLRLVGVLALGIIAILRAGRWAKGLEARREALEIERDRFFELSPDLLSVVGADGRFLRANGAWEASLGYRHDELVGRAAVELIHPDDQQRTIEESRRRHEPGAPVHPFLSRVRHADGSYRWLEWVSRAAPDGSVSFAVARDVTDRKQEEDLRARQQRVLEDRNEVLSERVVRDPLTGLHNRRYFDAAVARLELGWSRLPVGDEPPVSVVIFDLDHFGEINKLYGHQAGDAVLRVFSGLLRKRFRERDLVARYGGEEFVVVLESATSVEAIRIAEDIRQDFEHAHIDIGTETPIRVTVSAGCAQLGDDRNVLASLSLADVWLSQAKRAGRNQVVGL